MGIEVIEVSRAKQMIEFIKTHANLGEEKISTLCDIFLESIEEKKFKAYE